MGYFEFMQLAFLDELEKIGASHGRLQFSKTRAGRRPVSASTMLRKDKEGTLYKASQSYADEQANIDMSYGSRAPNRKPSDVPSREGNEVQARSGGRVTWEDGHNVQTIPGPAANTFSSETGPSPR